MTPNRTAAAPSTWSTGVTFGVFAAGYLVLHAAFHLGGLPEAWAWGLSGLLVAWFSGPLRALAAKAYPERRIVRAFARVARSLTSKPDLARLMVSTLQELLKVEHLYLWFPSPDGREFVLEGGQGKYPKAFTLASQYLVEVLRESNGRQVWTPRAVPAAAELLEATGAELMLPLLAQGRLLGLVALGPKRTRKPFTGTEGRMLAQFAENAAWALAHCELLEDQRRQLTRLETVSKLYQDAQRRAVTDGLTGLATHHYFQEQLSKTLSESRRFNNPLSLLLVDIDHFKKFNDTYGHQIGDEVLRQVARALQETARECDTVARYGGEEMALLLPQTDLEGARILAERIRTTVEALQLEDAEGRPIRKITVSIGLGELRASDKAPSTLIRRTDRALYDAKRAGRNRVVASVA